MEVRSLQDKYVVLKYLRLSIEDGDNTESDSISNQRELLDLHISVVFKDVRNLEMKYSLITSSMDVSFTCRNVVTLELGSYTN